MVTVFGKVRTLIYLLEPIDTFTLENTITHRKATVELDVVAVGNLYHVYTMDFKDVDYGEYQYRGYLDGVLKETGLFRLCHESDNVITPEEETNIVMYDGNEDTAEQG